MVIRLDNEHVIEESIIPFIWDDNTQTLIWWETPMRGNTYSVPTGSMGLTPEFPMMWSMTTYNEIQQISCIPTKEQAKKMFKAMLGDESKHNGTIKESSAIKIIDYYYNINSQAFQITSRNESPFDVTKIPSSELTTVFDTVEKLGKARAELFSVKIQEEISKKLTELRSLNTKFEGESEVVL